MTEHRELNRLGNCGRTKGRGFLNRGRGGVPEDFAQRWASVRSRLLHVGGPAARTASVLQASDFRRDVTVFRLNARSRPKTGSEAAFRRNTAERVYRIEAAHNPEVAGSNPAPATAKALHTQVFFCTDVLWSSDFCPTFARAHAG